MVKFFSETPVKHRFRKKTIVLKFSSRIFRLNKFTRFLDVKITINIC